MTEGRTFGAEFRRVQGGFQAWLEDKPEHRIEARSREEMLEQLHEIAVAFYGDGEAAFDLVELDSSTAPTSWVVLLPNTPLDTVPPDESVLYSGGVCTTCRAALGERTAAERTVDATGAKDHIAFVRGLRSLRGAIALDDAFIALLTDEERARLSLRRMLGLGRRRRAFWEVTGGSSIKAVALKEPRPSGWRCDTCGSIEFGYDDGSIYAPSAGVGALKGSVELIDCGVTGQLLLMQRSRWDALRVGGMRCSTNELGLVALSEVNSDLASVLKSR